MAFKNEIFRSCRLRQTLASISNSKSGCCSYLNLWKCKLQTSPVCITPISLSLSLSLFKSSQVTSLAKIHQASGVKTQVTETISIIQGIRISTIRWRHQPGRRCLPAGTNGPDRRPPLFSIFFPQISSKSGKFKASSNFQNLQNWLGLQTSSKIPFCIL